jgi:hypothetical protein
MVLEEYSVKFRYPGDSATKMDAKQALQAAQVVRTNIRTGLGLLNDDE